MIWDKKSKGTFNNILDLIIRNKKVVLYIPDTGTIIETDEALWDLIEDELYDEIFKKMKSSGNVHDISEIDEIMSGYGYCD